MDGEIGASHHTQNNERKANTLTSTSRFPSHGTEQYHSAKFITLIDHTIVRTRLNVSQTPLHNNSSSLPKIYKELNLR